MPFKIAFEIKLFSFIFDGSLPFSATFKVFQWHRQWSQRQCDNSAFMHSLDHLMILACIFFFLPFFSVPEPHFFLLHLFYVYYFYFHCSVYDDSVWLVSSTSIIIDRHGHTRRSRTTEDKQAAACAFLLCAHAHDTFWLRLPALPVFDDRKENKKRKCRFYEYVLYIIFYVSCLNVFRSKMQ